MLTDSTRLTEYARSSRHCVALDSLYWMRHPHPLISLLSLMLLCSIRARSHEQPLDTISLSAPRRLPSMRVTAASAHRLFPYLRGGHIVLESDAWP